MAFSFNPFTGTLDVTAPHKLLSSLHTDTLAASVVRGDIVYGNSTPAWARLAIGGANTVLFSNGTDVSWATSTGTGNNVLATGPSLTGPVTITEVVGSSALTLTGATQTSSFPVLNATQTWNASGTTFTGILLNVTNTASAVGSLLADYQLGGTSRWQIALGSWTATSGTNVAATLNPSFAPTSTSTMVGVGLKIQPTINYSNGTPGAGNYEALKIAATETALPTGTNYLIRASAGVAGTTDKWVVLNTGHTQSGVDGSTSLVAFGRIGNVSTGLYFPGSNQVGLVSNGTEAFRVNGSQARFGSAGVVAWGSDLANVDILLQRDAAAVLSDRNGTNAQGINLYNTFTSSTNFERLMFDWITNANVAMIYTQKGSGGGTARVLQLNYGGTTTNAISIPITSGPITTGGVIAKRVTTAADAASVTPNSSNEDITYQLNTQAAGTLTINADGGTPINGQAWAFKIKSTNAQTFSWNGIYVGGTVALPTTTSGSSKIDYFTFIYDTVNTKWHYTGTATGF